MTMQTRGSTHQFLLRCSTAIGSLTIVAMGSLPSNTVATDVAHTISGEALLLGICAVTSLINSYALYQFSKATGQRN